MVQSKPVNTHPFSIQGINYELLGQRNTHRENISYSGGMCSSANNALRRGPGWATNAASVPTVVVIAANTICGASPSASGI
jgi:hypothetical protein